MKINSKFVRRMKHFQEAMLVESLQTSNFTNPVTLEYQRIQQKFARVMEAHEQHGPVRVLVANGRRVGE